MTVQDLQLTLLGISWHGVADLQLVCFVAVFLRNASLAVPLG
jgi:hypothetical protein